MKYVVGFVFSKDLKNVLLIRKKKPAWQYGFYNGVGGKIEDEDSILRGDASAAAVAMARETREETGLDIGPQSWTYFARLEDRIATVDFFFATVEPCVITSAVSKTSEPVSIELTCNVPNLQTIPNLQWLIPLAVHWNTSLSGSRYAAPVLILEELQPRIGHHVFQSRCYSGQASGICIVCGHTQLSGGEIHV